MSRLTDLVLRYRRLLSVVAHALMVAAANLSAFALRFDGNIPLQYWDVALRMLPWLLAVRLVVFMPLRLYEGLWRYTSLWDLSNIVLGIGISTAAFVPAALMLAGEASYPRSIYIIDAVLLVCLMSGVRLTRRIYPEFTTPARGRRVLVYGAGDAGEMIVRDMRQNPAYDAWPVGFLDDDHRKRGQRIHGVPVLGARQDLARIVTAQKPDELLIAIPSATPEVLRAIVRQLEPFKVRISTLPRLSDLVGGRVGVRQIRQLKVEDLLARAAVALDETPVRAVLTGKRVLVTGAGGSIGSELCRQIAQARPELLLLLDRYENTLFTVHNEFTDAGRPVNTHCVIADVTDQRRVDQVLGEFRPHVVFHAAAHKHVPLMEDNPSEAVKNNVRGTRIVAEAAQRWGVERFVLISTDKAANPTSVMGAAKRASELVVGALDANGGPTRFVAVRFGNVLGSNGSVVPRFLSQIEAGGPVTVTHPEMRRYFMLIPEAVQLVLHAAAIDDRGAIFVLDMGEQVVVADMARNLIRLSGYIPDHEIEIAYTGVRPGEKLSEALIGDGERIEPSPVPKIAKVTGDGVPARTLELIADLEHAALEGQGDAVIEQLCRIVPAFTPKPRDFQRV